MKETQNGYYITEDNPLEKVLLEPQEEIHLSGMNLIELVLPQCIRVWCYDNQLTKLLIPMGCKGIHCSDNNLTQLIIPKTCLIVICKNNKLIQIITNLIESRDPVKIQLANNLQLANINI